MDAITAESPRGASESNAAGELAFLRSVLASSGDCIKVLSLAGELEFMTDAALEVMEVSDFNAIKGCPWPDFWAGGGNAMARAALDRARLGEEGRFEGEANTLLGRPKWWDVRVTPIRDETGQPTKLLVVSRDITVQKEAEQQRELLGLELAHRVKNILAMVQAIANASFKGSEESETLVAVFTARLRALAQAQDLLLNPQHDAPATLLDLLLHITAMHDPARIDITGPELVIGSRFSVSLALVVHELFTNALKYGALSNRTGRISISWTLTGEADDRLFEFAWSEWGGPLVVPPTRRGFGTRLIERSLVRGAGSGVVTYDASGVRFRLKTSAAVLSET